MRFAILLMVTFIPALSFAQSQGLTLTRDPLSQAVQGGYPTPSSINQVTISTAGTMVSATWPADTTDIVFFPPDLNATIYARANSASACPTGNVTNGTACEKNPAHRRVNVSVSGTTLSYYGVTSDVTGTVIRWANYSINKRN
jgi:hypothetical protein